MKRRRKKSFLVKNFPIIVVLVLLVLFIGMAIRMGMISAQFNQIQKANVETTSEFKKIKNENEVLKEKNNALSKQLSSLKDSNNKLKDELGQAQTDKQALQNKYDDAQKRLSKTSAAKTAYLTFDDGPSPYTAKLIEILAKNKVHATFFVVGTNVQHYGNVVKMAYANGNSIGIHCYNHDYPKIYNSTKSFFQDFDSIDAQLTTLLGASPEICRFPGGTGNTVSIRYGGPHFMQKVIPHVVQKGITPIDWDVDAGDAESHPASKKEVVNNILKQAVRYNKPVILCHDTKESTVNAIPSVIKELKKQGYALEALSPSAISCQQTPA